MDTTKVRIASLILSVKQAGDQNKIVASYKVSDKPLDFSFLNLTSIDALRKEVARGGIRKKIPESDDEED